MNGMMMIAKLNARFIFSPCHFDTNIDFSDKINFWNFHDMINDKNDKSKLICTGLNFLLSSPM